MSRDLKDLIDSIENKNRSHAELEREVESLKEEVRRLEFTVKEQKLLIQDQREKLEAGYGSDAPVDVTILKEMILSQRQELIKKDKNIEILEEKIEELNSKLTGEKSFEESSEQNEDLVIAKKVIVKLTDENEKLQSSFENARNEITKLQAEMDDLKELVVFSQLEVDRIKSIKIEPPRELIRADLEGANQKIHDLETETNELRETILYLNQEIEDYKKASEMTSDILKAPAILKVEDPDELIHANQKIESLKAEVEDLEAQTRFLNNELEKAKEVQIEKQDMEDLTTIKEENERNKRDLETMNLTITNLVQDIEGHLKEISEQNELIRKKNTQINVLQNKVDSLKQLNQELKKEVMISEDTGINHDVQKRDQWYEIQSMEVVKKLKEENEQLKELVQGLKEKLEPPLVLEDIPSEPAAVNGITSDLKRDYKLLVKESKELVEENQRLKDIITELKEQKPEAPIVVGYDPDAVDTFEDDRDDTIRFLKDENQELLNRMLELNLKIQEKEASINSLEKVKLNLIETHKKNIEEQSINFQEEVQKLNKIIEELQSSKASPDVKAHPNMSIQQAVPISYQAALFNNLISKLDSVQKEDIIDILIHHLDTGNVDVKRFVMSILSQIKKERVLDSLTDLVNDPNWLIRISLAKVFINYSYEEVEGPLNLLLKDKDPDVRETANKIFKKLRILAKKKTPEEECFREMEEFTPDRWNWCEKAGKWVFVKLRTDGKREYEFQLEPPKQFLELSMEMMRLNEKLMSTTDIDENQHIFEELMKISQKMQEMRKGGIP